jgi:glycosyltransferase involved in cell wall biosynthesis
MENKEPLVSVIIPAYNRAKSIGRSVDSIIRQSYKNWELVIVDDGSTDNTRLIIDEYIKKYHDKIKYFSYHGNKGASHARNFGIRESKGEFLAFLDSDDEFKEDKIKIQLEKMIEFKRTFSLTNFEVYINNKLKNNGINLTEPRTLKPIDLIFNKGSLMSVMIKKDIISQDKYFDEDLPSSNDYDFVLKYVVSNNILYLPDHLLKIHKSLDAKDDRISSNYSKKVKGYTELLKRVKENIYGFTEDDQKIFIVKLNGEIGMFKILNNEFVDGRKYLQYFLKNSNFSIKKAYNFSLYFLSYNKIIFNCAIFFAKILWKLGILKI